MGGFIPVFGQSDSPIRVYLGGGAAIPGAALPDMYHLRSTGYTITGKLLVPMNDFPIDVVVLTSLTRFSETLTFRGFGGTEEEQSGPYDHSMRFVGFGAGVQYEFLQGQAFSPFVEFIASANFIHWSIVPPPGELVSAYTANATRVGVAPGGGAHIEVPNSPVSLELAASFDLANLFGKQQSHDSSDLQIVDGGYVVYSLNFIAVIVGIGISL